VKTGDECPSWWQEYYGPSVSDTNINGAICCAIKKQSKGEEVIIDNLDIDSVGNVTCPDIRVCPLSKPEELKNPYSAASIVSYEISMIPLVILGLLLV